MQNDYLTILTADRISANWHTAISLVHAGAFFNTHGADIHDPQTTEVDLDTGTKTRWRNSIWQWTWILLAQRTTNTSLPKRYEGSETGSDTFYKPAKASHLRAHFILGHTAVCKWTPGKYTEAQHPKQTILRPYFQYHSDTLVWMRCCVDSF